MATKKQRLESDNCASSYHTMSPTTNRKSTNRLSHVLDDIELDESEANLLQNSIYSPLADKENTQIPSLNNTNKKNTPPPPIIIVNIDIVNLKIQLKLFEHYADTDIRINPTTNTKNSNYSVSPENSNSFRTN